MVESVKEFLHDKGFLEENIFYESFVASPPVKKLSFFENIFIE
jgi:hypothetical protein